jgi:hypothetical protein
MKKKFFAHISIYLSFGFVQPALADGFHIDCTTSTGEQSIYWLDVHKKEAAKIYPDNIKGKLIMSEAMYKIIFDEKMYKEVTAINRYNATMMQEITINTKEKVKQDSLKVFFSQMSSARHSGKCKKVTLKTVI